MTEARAAAARWARTWTEAWEQMDTEAIVALYAPDATFSTEPFREAYRGLDGVRAYVSQAFAEEESPRVWVSKPIVDGNRASISWWAALRENDADTTLAGTSVMEFDADGLVVEQWDAWNVIGEKRSPPSDWSPFAEPEPDR